MWILSIDIEASRNGSGVNPAILSQAEEPRFSSPWNLTLDCTTVGPGLAAIAGFDQQVSGVFMPFGEVLVGGTQLLRVVVPHAGAPTSFSIGIPPPSLALIDVPFFVQGACHGSAGATLSNALDVQAGE